MLTVTQARTAQDDAARHKVDGATKPLDYFVAAMLAGLFIGLADVFMLTAGGPLRAADSPWASLVAGSVFGFGLILVVFAGGELATSAMMILPMATVRRKISAAQASWAFLIMLLGNLAGSIITAGLVRGSGILNEETAAGQMLIDVVGGKVHHTSAELFFRAILCNILVCLAIWSASRCENEVAKMVLLSWCIAAFVGSGFEHVVANMTTLSLGLMHGVDAATWGQVLRNLGVVLLGNMVGGGVFVGGSYLLAYRNEH